MFPQNSRRIIREPARNIDEAEYPELWKGLVGAWSPCLSPRGGTVLRDLSGRQNHGTLTTMDPTNDWVLSGGKLALDLDGTNDNIITGTVPKVVAVSGWFHPVSSTGFRRLWQWGTNEFSAYLSTGSYGLQVIFSGASSDLVGGTDYATGYTMTANTWTHIGASYLNGTLRVYANGNQVSQHTPGANSTNKAFVIGASTGSAQPWNGMVDDVVVWSSGVNAAVMAAMFRLGRGGWATPRRNTVYFFTSTVPPVRPLYTTLKTSLGKNFIFRT